MRARLQRWSRSRHVCVRALLLAPLPMGLDMARHGSFTRTEVIRSLWNIQQPHDVNLDI
jgi:hypothetical protein